jgi:hypothetical protein
MARPVAILKALAWRIADWTTFNRWRAAIFPDHGNSCGESSSDHMGLVLFPLSTDPLREIPPSRWRGR